MKNLFLISICLIILGSCTDHKEVGTQLFDEGNYTDALYHFNEVIKMDPRNEMMFYNVGRCYEELREYDKAITAFDKSIKIKKPFPIAYLGRGRCYYKKEDYKSAVIDFGNTLYYEPKQEDALYYGALSYMKDSLYDKAQDAFIDLIELNPDHYKGRFNRGVLYATRANTLFALSDFTNLIRNEKLLKHSHYNRALVWHHMGRYEWAIKDFTSAYELGYPASKILALRAECYLSIDRPQEACLDFQNLAELKPEEGKALLRKYCQEI